jgi:hypothetical protein
MNKFPVPNIETRVTELVRSKRYSNKYALRVATYEFNMVEFVNEEIDSFNKTGKTMASSAVVWILEHTP